MKNIIKFKHEGHEGFLSYVEKDNNYYALVEKDTHKVQDILKSHKLLVSFELKQPVFEEVEAHISFDEALIKWVYQKLEEDKNLYFKQLDDTLCVLSIEKNH